MTTIVENGNETIAQTIQTVIKYLEQMHAG